MRFIREKIKCTLCGKTAKQLVYSSQVKRQVCTARCVPFLKSNPEFKYAPFKGFYWDYDRRSK